MGPDRRRRFERDGCAGSEPRNQFPVPHGALAERLFADAVSSAVSINLGKKGYRIAHASL